MRAIWWRELRELLIVGLAAIVAMAVVGSQLPEEGLREESMMALAMIGGGVGLFQGLLDRRRRDDGFLLHRPIGTLRIHVARSLAGATICAVGVVAAAASSLVDVWLAERQAERMRAARVGYAWFGPPRDWGASNAGYFGGVILDARGVWLGLSLLLGGWALVRFAASRRRVATAMLVAAALSFGGWSLIARCPSVSFAGAAAMVLVVVLSSLSVLDLAGDRR